MSRLIDGYRRFRSDVWPAARARYEALAQGGQSPETLVIACSDSRVDPATVFGAAPGELFVVRNVAGLVPPYQPDAHYHGTSAAIEFAVQVLRVKEIVVLGHAQCGGVRAMVEGVPESAGDFVAQWIKLAEPALRAPVRRTEAGDIFTHRETEVVRLSLKNLGTFPFVAAAIETGRLRVHGYRFDIHSGVLAELGANGFTPVD